MTEVTSESTLNRPKDPKSPIVVALDYSEPAEALALAKQLNPNRCRLKVGKELFTSAGPAVVESLQSLGFDIFLDLKFHDIPNTVAKACRAAAKLGVWMVNVHASGGERMMVAAKEALDNVQHRPILTAVTVLTSMDQQDLSQINIGLKPERQVLHFAKLAKQSGVDGVVCSAQEAEMLKQSIEAPFVLVTPGIRLDSGLTNGQQADDQRRVVTPKMAVAMGSDYLVIGRPITQAESPAEAVEAVLQMV